MPCAVLLFFLTGLTFKINGIITAFAALVKGCPGKILTKKRGGFDLRSVECYNSTSLMTGRKTP
jgi:hypothetical protein